MNKLRCGSWSLLLVLLLVEPMEIGLAQGTFVMPRGAESSGGMTVTGLFYDVSASRYQCVYGSYDMELPNGVHYITGMRLRLPGAADTSFNVVIPDVEIRLSTTWHAPDLLDPVFARNTGQDEVVVHGRGQLQLNATVVPGVVAQPFATEIPFDTPFLYDRSWGNLLVDIRTYDAGTHAFPVGGMVSPSSSPDSISSVWGTISSTSGFVDTQSLGMAVQFEYQAVPEPSLLDLAGLGSLVFLLGRRVLEK